MSALSVSSNLPSLQAPAPAQGNDAPEDSNNAFSSVLQQKVQAGNKDGSANSTSKPTDKTQAQVQANSNASNGTNNTSAAQAVAKKSDQDKQDADADTASNTPSALDIAKGDASQTALQQLLPFLQGLQGKTKADAKHSAKTDASTDAVPLVAVINPAQTAPALQADDKSVGGKGTAAALDAKADSNAAKGTPSAATDTDKTNAAANLAAKEAATSGVTSKPDGAFDAALDKASAQANAQAAALNHNTAANAGAANVNGNGSDATRMQAQFGSPQWPNELGDHVQLMSRNNESRAELVLNPPQLGRIEVSLNISGDHASATFTSPNPDVRAALEGAMDRLREVLANNGISLGQAHVGADSSSSQWANGQQTASQRGSSNAMMGAALDPISGSGNSGGGNWTRHSNNMLDVFA